jgi:hypothetical protein
MKKSTIILTILLLVVILSAGYQTRLYEDRIDYLNEELRDKNPYDRQLQSVGTKDTQTLTWTHFLGSQTIDEIKFNWNFKYGDNLNVTFKIGEFITSIQSTDGTLDLAIPLGEYDVSIIVKYSQTPIGGNPYIIDTFLWN